MDLEQEIEEISKNTIKILSNKNVTINMLEWVLAQVKENICAKTRITSSNVDINISDKKLTDVITEINKISKIDNVSLQF